MNAKRQDQLFEIFSMTRNKRCTTCDRPIYHDQAALVDLTATPITVRHLSCSDWEETYA